MAPILRARSPTPLPGSYPARCCAALAWRRASPSDPPIKPRPIIATRLNINALQQLQLEVDEFFQPCLPAFSQYSGQQVGDFVAQPYNAFPVVKFLEAGQYIGVVTRQQIGGKAFEQERIFQVVLRRGILVPVETAHGNGRFAVCFRLKYLRVLLVQVFHDDSMRAIYLMEQPERSEL